MYGPSGANVDEDRLGLSASVRYLGYMRKEHGGGPREFNLEMRGKINSWTRTTLEMCTRTHEANGRRDDDVPFVEWTTGTFGIKVEACQ